MAVALMALDAALELTGPERRARRSPIGDFHQPAGRYAADRNGAAAGRDDHRHRRAGLRRGATVALSEGARPGELRVRAGFRRCRAGHRRRHDPFGAALPPAELARKPWRLPEVEAALTGKPADASDAEAAADQAGAGAQARHQNAFKLILLRRTVLRALQTVSA